MSATRHDTARHLLFLTNLHAIKCRIFRSKVRRIPADALRWSHAFVQAGIRHSPKRISVSHPFDGL